MNDRVSDPHSQAGHGQPPLVEKILAPFRQFAGTTSAGGVLLLAATIVALVWANSPLAGTYDRIWNTDITLGIGERFVHWSLRHFINDGLMAVFFFLVGLEIKREMQAGELKSIRTATLPLVAALGGMLVPAVLYSLVNRHGPAAAGWGVPMATDIAFALGVLALLGDRVPNGLKVFLAALAILDDIGAVLVIALFYSGGIEWGALAAAAAILLMAVIANTVGIRHAGAYAAIGVLSWITMIASGVHATVAGVLLAFTIPVRTRINEGDFLSSAYRALDDFDAAAVVTAADPEITVLSNTGHHTAIEELETLCEQAQPPLIRMEHALQYVVAFVIIPLFALANAGVSLSRDAVASSLSSSVALGVMLGLIIGKPLGITAFCFVAVRLGIAVLPDGVTWHLVGGAAMLAGIGFTMAIFIANLAFTDPGLLAHAKLGILSASIFSGLGGWLILRAGLRSRFVSGE